MDDGVGRKLGSGIVDGRKDGGHGHQNEDAGQCVDEKCAGQEEGAEQAAEAEEGSGEVEGDGRVEFVGGADTASGRA